MPLSRLKKVIRRHPLGAGLSAVGVGSAGILLGIFLVVKGLIKDLPEFISLGDYRPLGVTQVWTRDAAGNQQLLTEFYRERRYLIPFEKLPELVIRAFISAEDDSFFEHEGVSPVSMLRAAIANFRAGQVVQGGSTITQQVAKSLFLSSERSFSRKIKELVLAQRIESNLTKQQILYLYLNQIYLGHGAYGIQAASRAYFHKDVGQLTLPEAALLAGLPRAPSKFSPFVNPTRAKERQLYVLRRMREGNFITEAQAKEAGQVSLKIFHELKDVRGEGADYYVEQVRRHLVQKYGDKAVYEEGLSVYTQARLELLEVGQQAVKDGIHLFQRRHGWNGIVEHLEPSTVGAWQNKAQEDSVHARLQYEIFAPDGTLAREEAKIQQGIRTSADWIVAGHTYKGVVTQFDGVNIEGKVGDAPFVVVKDGWTWAAQSHKEAFRLVPGDVIWIRTEKKINDQWQATLEGRPEVQAALVSLDVRTGQVLGLAGGYSFEGSEFNRATQAKRQPGSSFKPLVYTAAIEHGFTPSSIIVDAPLVFESENLGTWKPENIEEEFYGDTTLRTALVKSRNVPTIKIAESIKIPAIVDAAQRLGIQSTLPMDLSVSLGSGVVTPLELVSAYATFPRQGKRLASPIFLNKVVDRDGRVLEMAIEQPPPTEEEIRLLQMRWEQVDGPAKVPQYPPEGMPQQTVDPRVAYVMTQLMKDVVEYGTGQKAKALGRTVAGKTGTSSDNHDAWFVGFVPQIVTGVWIGYDDQRSMGGGETGSGAALPIWLRFMQEAVKALPQQEFVVPPGVTLVKVDAKTGQLASQKAAQSVLGAYIAGTEPKTVSTQHTSGEFEPESEFLRE